MVCSVRGNNSSLSVLVDPPSEEKIQDFLRFLLFVFSVVFIVESFLTSHELWRTPSWGFSENLTASRCRAAGFQKQLSDTNQKNLEMKPIHFCRKNFSFLLDDGQISQFPPNRVFSVFSGFKAKFYNKPEIFYSN